MKVIKFTTLIQTERGASRTYEFYTPEELFLPPTMDFIFEFNKVCVDLIKRENEECIILESNRQPFELNSVTFSKVEACSSWEIEFDKYINDYNEILYTFKFPVFTKYYSDAYYLFDIHMKEFRSRDWEVYAW